jgi:hypothetical protein
MVGSYAATAGKALPVFAPPQRLVKRLRLIWQRKEPALMSEREQRRSLQD